MTEWILVQRCLQDYCDRQTDRQTDRKTDRQTEKQTDINKNDKNRDELIQKYRQIYEPKNKV